MKEDKIMGEVQYFDLPVEKTYEALASFFVKFQGLKSFDLGVVGTFSIGAANFDKENNVISIKFILEKDKERKEVQLDYYFKKEDENKSSFYMTMNKKELEFLDSIDFNIDEVIDKAVEQM